MADAHPPGRAPLFTIFLMIATVAMSVVILRQRSQIATLDNEIRTLTTQVGQAALPKGEILAPLSTFAAGTSEPDLATLDFAADRRATLIFVHSAACAACESLWPRIELLGGTLSRLGGVVVALQLDAESPDNLKRTSGTIRIRGVTAHQGTWLKRVPLVPSILLVDRAGTLRAAWYGAPVDAQWAQIQAEIATLAAAP